MELAIIGGGGHSKVVQDIVRLRKNDSILAVLDDKYAELTRNNGVYIGPIRSALSLLDFHSDMKFVLAIGNNAVRKSIVQRLGLPNDRYISLIHDTAVISPGASIGHGTVVMAHTVVNSDARVGNHAIVNTGAVVEHDNVLEDYVHIAPRATLTGSVRVREGSLIGAGATIIPGCSIGEWATVGAGATVIRDVPPNCTAVGTPAKIMKAESRFQKI